MQSDSGESEAIVPERLGALERAVAQYERTSSLREAELRRIAAELEQKSCMLEGILKSIPEGVVVCDGEGRFLHYNEAAETILGLGPIEGTPSEWVTAYGVFQADTVTPYPADELPMARAIRGESVLGVRLFLRHAAKPLGVWVDADVQPLRLAGGEQLGAIAVFRDVTETVRLQEELQSQLLAEKEQNEALRRMQDVIHALSTPVLEIWDGVLVLPIIGIVDPRRGGEIMSHLLEEVSRRQCRFVLLDITGVEVVDEAIAGQFLKIVRSVKMLGAHCFLTGVRPDVAQVLVALDVDLSSLVALRNLRHGLQKCLPRMNESNASGAFVGAAGEPRVHGKHT